MSAPENPPAFPVSSIDGFTQHGMTLRAYFAGQVLGPAFSYAASNVDRGTAIGVLPEEWAVHIALGVADAMLVELTKSGGAS